MKKIIIFLALVLVLSGGLITLIVLGNPFSPQEHTDYDISNDIEIADAQEEIPYIMSEADETYDYAYDNDSAEDEELPDFLEYPYPPPTEDEIAHTYYADDVEVDQLTDFEILTATQLVANIRMGWVLGNTFDAHENMRSPESMSVRDMETRWIRHVTTQQHFDIVREAGFNAVRIPVTWYKATDLNYNIREDWMARIVEVVGYAVNNDMYIVLNTHHDEAIFKLHDDEMEETKIALARVWEQIALTFREFNEKLIFEGLNEPRTLGSPNEWRGGTEEERENLNILNQLFVDTVRSTGGNNSERVLMIPTYAASGSEVAQRGLRIPNDTVEDRIIVSLHVYSPWEFALRTGHEGTWTTWDENDPRYTRQVTTPIDLAYELFVSQGIPVIMGEMGAINRGNTEARTRWAEFYVAYARSRGIPCFWWDNYRSTVVEELPWGWTQPFGLLDRGNNVFFFPEIIEALMRGAGD